MNAIISKRGESAIRGACLLLALAIFAAPAAAQTSAAPDSAATETTVAAVTSPVPAPSTAVMVSPASLPSTGVLFKEWATLPAVEIQYYRPHDARGLNMFEPPKVEGMPYTGNKIAWGAGFAQQFQHLTHENTAAPKIVSGVNVNKLIDIGPGFNNADANLYLDAQMSRGIRVALTTYLSSRHHNETWVKDGYLLMDASPIKHKRLEAMMKYMTVRAGHFEINYGDQHFRSSDNGNAIFNPFVGNLIMNAFTTEIGIEAYARAHDFMGMAGITGGAIKGQVTQPGHRTPTYLGKAGFDRQFSNTTRVRLTGSIYRNALTTSNTLYSGSRAGSRYYDVLENTQSTESANAWSGEIQPGFSQRVTAMVLNPFIKFHGLELFGNFEQAEGGSSSEPKNRIWHQNAGEAVYRFFDEQFYVGGRYNQASGALNGISNTVTVERTQVAGGWFLTPRIVTKLEYVKQTYRDFPSSDIRNGGKFEGFMFEGVVGF